MTKNLFIYLYIRITPENKKIQNEIFNQFHNTDAHLHEFDFFQLIVHFVHEIILFHLMVMDIEKYLNDLLIN